MKRLAILILTALILAACTPKAFTASMDAGKLALQEGNYTDAVNHFENALEERKTDDAKEYLQLAESLQESLDLYQNGDLEAALFTIKKVITEKSSEKFDSKIIKTANKLMDKIIETKTFADSVKEAMVKGKTLLGQNQFEEAYEVFQQIAETSDFTEHSLIEKAKQDAAELLVQTTKLKNAHDAEQEKQKQEEEQKQKEEEEKQNQEEASKTLTHEQAEELVRTHLNLQSNPTVYVRYDHDSDNGDYIIHVYETVIDDAKTGEGHTATWGWYGVNKTTKEIYDAMN